MHRKTNLTQISLIALLAFIVGSSSAPRPTLADSASEIDRKVMESLNMLYNTSPGAKLLGAKAKAVLVFPKIVKVSFLGGTQIGDGALVIDGKPAAYYRSVAASFGLQAGLTAFDYVLMFMDDESLDYFNRSNGWELGTGPGIVVMNRGFTGSASTTTLRKGIHAFAFDHKGVMMGVNLEGTKITRFNPKP